ncbi:unnamed protein product [Prunus brigantina]
MHSHGQEAQSPRSGRWPRFAEIYGGHTVMLHDPKCRFDCPLTPALEHYPCYRLTHPIYHTTIAPRATRRSTAQNPPPTPPLNGLVAQAVNLTAEISSSLGHNRLIRSPTPNRRTI